MSYSAPPIERTPGRHSIDTICNSWLIPYNSLALTAAWPSANLAIYVPLRIPCRVLVLKLWFASFNTGTGNVDMGLYDVSGAAVISATNAAKGATTQEQVFDVTDTPVGPGLYYIALASDSGTDTFVYDSSAAPMPAANGIRVEASAYPLPATATWSVSQTLAFVPLMGVLIGATVT
jgi:hypothetical protein